VIIYVTFIFISSPFLFVYGDDRVIRYTGADADTSDINRCKLTSTIVTNINLHLLSH